MPAGKPIRSITIAAQGLILAALALSALGCGKGPAAPDPPPAASAAAADRPLLSPEDVLARMVAAYRHAPGYHDQGELVVEQAIDGETALTRLPFSVAFAQPGSLRLRAGDLEAVYHRGRLAARVLDPATNDLHGQVLVKGAPAEVSIEEIYGNELLTAALLGSLHCLPPQLELLFHDRPFESLSSGQAELSLGPPGQVEGRHCYRLEVHTETGMFTLWIDEASYALRRMEYPAAPLAVAPERSETSGRLSLVAELRGASLTTPPPEIFYWPLPRQAKPVGWLVRAPLGEAPSALGQTPGGYAFQSLDGAVVSDASLRGKPCALVWLVGTPDCHECLKAFDEASRRFAAMHGEGSARRLAIVVDSAALTVDSSQLAVEMVRDLSAVGRDHFGVEVAPTLALLDAAGKVQAIESAANPYFASTIHELPALLAQVARGDDLAGKLREAIAQQRVQYQQELSRAAEAAADWPLEAMTPESRSAAPHSAVRPLATPAH